MSYSDFVDTFTGGCSLVLNSIKNMASSLMSNYIFITILGLVLLISLFWFLYDMIIIHIFEHNIDKIKDKQDLYDRYDEFRHMRYEWNINHMHLNEMEAVNRYQVNKNAFNLVFGKQNNKRENNNPPEPEWLNKDVVIVKPSPSEQAEIDELLKNF